MPLATVNRPAVGRFAPTPSGPLHFGSLITAIASWMQARSKAGLWYLRLDDLDRQRTVAGAEESILKTLEKCGLYWDGQPYRQSAHQEAYKIAVEQLWSQRRLFPCACSRQAVSTLWKGCHPSRCGSVQGRSLRCSMDDPVDAPGAAPGAIEDAQRSPVPDHNWEPAIVVHYANLLSLSQKEWVYPDMRYAYHLATVVDEHEMGITEVVRGADLLDVAPLHRQLSRILGFTPPVSCHVPVAANAQGQKLSKQTLARAVPEGAEGEWLRAALRFLGQPVPDELQQGAVPVIINHALVHWDLQRVPQSVSITVEGEYYT